MKLSGLSIAILVLALASCSLVPGSAPGTSAAPVWTGFLEGTAVDVSPEVGGRIASLLVDEGAQVQAGQPLLTVKDDLARQRAAIADAKIAIADAQLALLEAGARAEDIARAEAQVELARMGVVAATQALSDTLAVRANPQTLMLAQAQARFRLEAARQGQAIAVIQAQAADIESRFWADQVSQISDGVDIRLPNGTTRHFNTPAGRLEFANEQWNLASQKAWEAWAAVKTAEGDTAVAQAALEDLTDQIQNSVALDARVDQARGALGRAQAAQDFARAVLVAIGEGASLTQIQAARAAVDQARSARASLEPELAHYTVRAPQAGTVSRVYYRLGEIVSSAVPVLTLRDETQLKLRVFVPMSQLSTIRLEQRVKLVLPELDGSSASGTVSFVADQAEFTGRQAQTDSERNAQLVAVEVTLDRTEAGLKAGMPASVAFDGSAPTMTGPVTAAPAASPVLAFSGTLDARQTRISAEVSARVTAVRVQRGDLVKVDDRVIELDDTTLNASQAESNAALRTAQANLEQARAKPQAGAVGVAEAAVIQARADLDAATLNYNASKRVLDNPQELASQVHSWQAQVQAAEGEVERAQAVLAGLKVQVEIAARDQSQGGKARLQVVQAQEQAAEVGLSAAQAVLKGKQAVLFLYRMVLANPLELLASMHGAESQVRVATAALKVAEADLAIARRDPQSQAVAVAEAGVAVAQANSNLIKAQASRLVLTTPVGGTVVSRSVEPGEIVRPGTPLLAVADTRELELTLFVPVQYLNRIHLGQSASVRLPSLPNQTFAGQVTFISPQAEFKPANIYNSQDRAEMVFQVRVLVPNGDGQLKAGLPADATLQ